MTELSSQQMAEEIIKATPTWILDLIKESKKPKLKLVPKVESFNEKC